MSIVSMFYASLLAGTFIVAGCAASSSYRSAPHEAAAPSNAIVLDRAAIGDRARPIVQAMKQRYPWMVEASETGCPSFSLRRASTARGLMEPLIYVDGARAADTCVLVDIDARDVERVEIYPLGVTSRPGYATNPRGLILVFLRDGP